MTEAPDILAHYRARVEQALEARLPRADTTPTALHAAMRYATLNGGKRIRAALVYATGETLGAAPASLDPPACAVELIHAYSLVHDDLPCMDDDELRRGQPTCHKAFDEATAMLAGDALQSLAFEILAGDPALEVDAQRRQEMILTFARAIGAEGMAGGQAIDLAVVGRPLGPEALEDMHARKTGALIRASVCLGALAAPDAGAALLEDLDAYGRHIGLAFQIVDDILDVEGSTEVLGKTAGADQALGKPTYPAVLGMEAAKARALALRDAALESLGPLGDNAKVLEGIAHYIVDRAQ